jgi:hypothetical protein
VGFLAGSAGVRARKGNWERSNNYKSSFLEVNIAQIIILFSNRISLGRGRIRWGKTVLVLAGLVNPE